MVSTLTTTTSRRVNPSNDGLHFAIALLESFLVQRLGSGQLQYHPSSHKPWPEQEDAVTLTTTEGKFARPDGTMTTSVRHGDSRGASGS